MKYHVSAVHLICILKLSALCCTKELLIFYLTCIIIGRTPAVESGHPELQPRCGTENSDGVFYLPTETQ